MGKKALLTPLTLRIFGATIGALGFIMLAYQINLMGSAFIGIGSVLIAAGET